MVDTKRKEDCCGCRACEAACPAGAITMREDEKGFLYPSIDPDLCTRCGLCDKVCAFCEAYPADGAVRQALAVKARDEAVRRSSSSGGMFTLLSDQVLKQGGAVYGAAFADDWSVVHRRAETPEEREALKRSKYVQSDMEGIYRQVREDLRAGREVLFAGTPCQVAALRSFLGEKNTEKLLTADLVCHGVPNNRMWKESVAAVERANRCRVTAVNFRDKSLGWHQNRVSMTTVPAKKWLDGEQSYFNLFVRNYILRPSCHHCVFANVKRPGDLTLADFWGIEGVMPEFDDNIGTSLVLVNSEKGTRAMEALQGLVEMKQTDLSSCMQGQMQKPGPTNSLSEATWADYEKHGMEYIMRKYTNFTRFKLLRYKVKRRIRYILGLPIS